MGASWTFSIVSVAGCILWFDDSSFRIKLTAVLLCSTLDFDACHTTLLRRICDVRTPKIAHIQQLLSFVSFFAFDISQVTYLVISDIKVKSWSLFESDLFTVLRLSVHGSLFMDDSLLSAEEFKMSRVKWTCYMFVTWDWKEGELVKKGPRAVQQYNCFCCCWRWTESVLNMHAIHIQQDWVVVAQACPWSGSGRDVLF